MRLPKFVRALFADIAGSKTNTPGLTIYEAAARQRRKVLANEGLAVKRLLGAWKVAQKNIDQRLAAITEKIAQAKASGQAISPAWLYQQSRWVEFLATIEAEIDHYSDSAAKITTAQQAKAVDLGGKHAAELVKAAGVTSSFKTLPRSAFANVVGFLTDKSPIYDLFKQLGPEAVQIARAIFAEEIGAGQNPKVIAKRFRDQLDMTKTRSVLIARTESLRAYRTSAQLNYERNSDVVIAGRWSSSRDSRTCYLCLAKDGTIIPHGSSFPAHPGCRCAIVPVVKYLDVDRGTGEEWLEQQPEAVQRAKLGPSRYELWKSKQASLQDMVTIKTHPRWGDSVQSVNLQTIKGNIASGIKAAPQKTTVNGMGLVAKPYAPPVAPNTAPAAIVAPTPSAVPVAAIDPVKLAAKFPAPPSEKTQATHYTKKLIHDVGNKLEPAEVSALVKHYFPLSTSSPESVLELYKKMGVAPKGGFPSAYQFTPPTPKPKPVPKAKPIPEPKPVAPAPAPEAPAADVILAKQIEGQKGSNPGGLYLGSDGVQRYVKFYPDETQAYCEHLSNEIYRGLGLKAPVSALFENAGRVTYASEILPTTGTVGASGLTKATADEILEGFMADVLTANWDAVGSGLDNVVLLKGGGVAKIDQGGTLLFRAKAGYKPDSVLNDIPEWEGFFNPSINPNYVKVTQKAGISQAEELGASLQKQAKAIKALRAQWGGWKNFVAKNAPGMKPEAAQKVAAMLEARTTLVLQKADKAKATLKQVEAAKKLAAIQAKKAEAAAAIQAKKDAKEAAARFASIKKYIKVKAPKQLSDAEGLAMRKRLYSALWDGRGAKAWTAEEKKGIRYYKDSVYFEPNAYLRGESTSLGETARFTIDKVFSATQKAPGLDEEIMLFRGFGHSVWYHLEDKDIGQYLTDEAILSTSNNERFAKDWGSTRANPVVVRIRTPKGLKALPAGDPGYSDYEHEFIVQGAKYLLLGTKWETINGKKVKVLDVELHYSMEGSGKWRKLVK